MEKEKYKLSYEPEISRNKISIKKIIQGISTFYFEHQVSFWVVSITLLLTTISFLFLILFVNTGVKEGLKFLFDNLPLTLPILTVLLSIASRPHEMRTRQGFLNIGNYFALGLVSFSIWAYVAGQNVSSYIFISSNKVMNKDYSLLLVLCSFILAGFSAVVTSLAEKKDSEKNIINWQIIQIILFAVSFVLMFAPYYLFENKQMVEKRERISFDISNYQVTLVYRDALLNKHVGLKGFVIDEAVTYRGIRAKTPEEARSEAKAIFNKTINSFMFNPRIMAPDSSIENNRVEIIDNMITVEKEK